ncbi:phosphotransferase [Nocardia sp. NEAU-G5]|uniref:Phosphotransferase n=1 Tax=Nocardia albiluteola TaxID=2842303 RepID=A0ABS6BD37_9NOCA|nr:aminoglycoside phosphotransferase family protein [Nocardia albiluteola]MBU3068048.1 phosphotransferase [Nocardia albiluteola]
MFTTETIIPYLIGRGVLPRGSAAAAYPLSGGVSNEVLAVRGDGVDVVVKQALPRLRVAQEWVADPARILVEAAALRLAGELDPTAVPKVIDTDDQALTLTIERARGQWTDWKTQLLAGTIDPAVAGTVATALARWHTGTADRSSLAADFGNTHFESLRIAPFYRAAGAAHPGVAGKVDALADQLLRERTCLVHGDFSPKNILVNGTDAWVIDWEVAHYGSPVFDLAFLNTHLLLKAVHRPEDTLGYHGVADAFNHGYTSAVHGDLVPESGQLAAHVGCLLLARVDGKSPAEYLTHSGRGRVRELALAALHRAADLEELWKTIS